MDRLKKGKITKKIIYIVVVLMLCNFIIPNYTFAVETEGGGTLLGTIAELFCIIPDAVINLLQNMFVSENMIRIDGFTDNDDFGEQGGYMILYSPVTIFAGKIPAFDINFINPGDSTFSLKNASRVVLGIGDNKEKVVEQSVSGVMRMLDYDTEISNTETLTKPLEEIKSYVYNKDNWNPDNYKDITIANDKYSLYCSKDASTARLIWYFDKDNSEDGWKSTEYCEYDGEPNDQSYVYNEIKSYLEEKYGEVPDGYNEDKENVKNQLQSTIDSLSTNDVTDGDEKKITLKNGDKEATIYIGFAGQQVNSLPKYHISYFEMQNHEYDEGKEYKSSAKILQTTVATWYNALRRIALVGLLSVLLYIGIRIVMTSTSAKDKAKYKKMLKDWLIALCMLFVLHYVMSVIIIVVENINEVISASVIGEDGEDALMTTIRNEIGGADNWGNAIAYVAIYCTLTVYTIIFTIQYIRRVIYLAFLTMIAPLITLTYPLDKIKDNKAQAFDMWLKDYIFFSLIQVLHLLIYYIFVSSAIELSNKGNWLYAIVAVGFITKAEKIMKKMFGFEKSKSMGALAAGATGALVSNLMNKGPHGGGVKHPGGNAGSSGSASTKAVRTQTTFPLQQMSFGGSMGVPQQSMAQQGIPQQSTSQQGTAQQSTPQQGTARQSTPQQGTARQSTSQPSTARQNTSQQSSPQQSSSQQSSSQQSSSQQSTAGQSSPQQGTARQSTLQQSTARQSTSQPNTAQQNPAQQVTSQQGTAQQNSVQVPYTKPQRNIKGGVWALTKKYHRKVGGTIVGIGTGATGAMLGFAAGVSQGDLGVALGGAVAGGKSGFNLGDRAYNGVFDTAGNIIKEKDNIWDTAREGAYGEEYANNVKFDREFRRSNDYKELRKKYSDSSKPHTMQMLDADVQQMLDAGISDSKQMDKILKNNRKHPRKYSMDNAIKYSQMAENCKDKVLYDKKSFIRFCRDNDVNDLSDENLEKIRKCIIEFK